MVNDSSLSHMYEKAAYIRLFDALVGHNLLLEANPPFFTILAATTQRLQDVGMTKDAVMGKALFEAHPGNPTDPTDNGVSNLRSSLDHVLRYKEAHQLPVQRYDLPDEQGGFSEKYWRASNRPVLNKEGEVAYIIHTAEDITHEIRAQELREKIKGLEQAYGLFMQAPFAIHIFTGPELVIDMANPPTLDLWGKTEEVTGQRFLDVLPELKGQGYDTMMRQVMRSGTPQLFYEVPLALNRPGKEPIGYFSFIYQPYYKEGALNAESVLIIAHEVTQQVLAKKSKEESDARFRNLIDEAPVATCLFVGTDLVLEVVNPAMLDIFGKGDHVQGMKFTDALPELESQSFPEVLRQVLLTGESYTGLAVKAELFKDGRLGTYYFNSSYKPIRNAAGEVYAVLGMAVDVTEQVLSKKALEESEQRFQNLVRDATAGIIVLTGPEMITEVVNEAFGKLIGRTPEELLEQPLFNIIPETEAYYRPICEKVLQTGEPVYLYDSPYTVVADGKKIDGFLHLTYQPYREPEGNTLGVMIICQDVTESVKARKALEESEQKLQLALAAGNMGTFVWHPQQDQGEPDMRMLLLFGLTPDSKLNLVEALGSMIHPDDRLRYAGEVKEATDPLGNGALQSEFRVIYPDQTVHWISIHGQTYFDAETKLPVRMSGMASDITEQVEARKRLEESESRFRLLANEMPQFVWTGETTGNLAYFNQAVYEYSGLSVEEIAYSGWIQIVHPEDRDENIRHWQHCIATGEDFIFEHRFKRADGEYRWQLSRAVAQRDAQGIIQQWIGTSTDIQDQKNVEEQLETLVAERTKELQRSNEDLQQFAHVASHDLKEPVRKIRTFGSRLSNEFGDLLPEKAKGYVSRMESATTRIYSMIEGVLLYSSLNALEGASEAVDLNDTVQNIETDLELSVLQKGVVIRYQSLPIVKGIPILLYQLFYNLINNSIKFSSAEAPPVISITSDYKEEATNNAEIFNDYVSLVVQDNGIGFDQSQAEEIFRTFTRLNTKDKYEGTGLGLALCKKIVERHGGTITAQSLEGEGARFIFTLPLFNEK